MSSKENAAVFQLFEKLECRYALRVLWALRDGHPQTFRLLQDSVGGITPNTLNTRIKELREAGFMNCTAATATSSPPRGRICSSACPTCRPLPTAGRQHARRSKTAPSPTQPARCGFWSF